MKDINNVRQPRPPQPPFVRINWIPFGSIVFGAMMAFLLCIQFGLSGHGGLFGFWLGLFVGLPIGAVVGLFFNRVCYPIVIPKETP